jgi:hypothetical protein
MDRGAADGEIAAAGFALMRELRKEYPDGYALIRELEAPDARQIYGTDCDAIRTV